MSLSAIQHDVILLCADLPRTRAFYHDVMGFRLETDQPNWVSFSVGSTLLTLRPRGAIAGAQDGPAVPGSAAIQLAFRVPHAAVDVCYAELLAKGVSIIRGPTDLPAWRHRTVFFRDPENNVIEIYGEYHDAGRPS
jgi:catechol 2,3-dioxygenase-like lactoylglutathione lyase family enzyme